METNDDAVRVTVLKPCACDFCASNDRRWWSCLFLPDRRIAEYDCAAWDGTGVPDPSHVAQIERMHPGAVYLYIDGGQEFDRQLAAARAQLSVVGVVAPPGDERAQRIAASYKLPRERREVERLFALLAEGPKSADDLDRDEYGSLAYLPWQIERDFPGTIGHVRGRGWILLSNQ